MSVVDLRSDTVTAPTQAMRAAMAAAEVGDDVFGDDPTVNRLEALAARMMGKEAALFVPSGTMGNLAAVLAHCGRGDEVILGDQCHTFNYEAGGIAALGGVHPMPVQTTPDGRLPLESIEAAIRGDNVHFPTTRLICLENTHNRCGGAVLDEAYTRAVGELAKRHALKLHLDGARIFNAAAALGVPARSLAAPADSVTFCLSKALSAPVGSVLCGEQAYIDRARRIRKQLGGGMRQAGILAAAGIVALETMVDRLPEDHRRARALAQRLGAIPGILVEDAAPPSNMVYIRLAPDAPLDETELQQALASQAIKIGPVGPRRIRFVLHHWVDDEGVQRTVEAIRLAMVA
ncbi:MAG: low-specificity L-threonine aldolase [Chloroflexi bacterium]|nr:low-specificity L-threonine aldolase [Chloroflexota bacterium]